ncbi:MAG: VOC family protein [Magnetococcales bacterium]|nr:VOC family protein [Magnetococcales bacterium]
MTIHTFDTPTIDLNFFGPNAHHHHTGMATSSIESICGSGVAVDDPIQRVRVAFIRINGLMVELVEPWDDKAPVALSLKKGIKILHLCYTVPNLKESLKHCRPHGLLPISKPQPAVAFGGRLITWVFSNQYGLFELIENGDQNGS